MRLGQGYVLLPSAIGVSNHHRFNSYTQQTCIDDAVVIDAQRAENVLTNDGSTMRIIVQSMGKPSAWSRQKEIVLDDRDQHVKDEAQATKPEASFVAGESSGAHQSSSVPTQHDAVADAGINCHKDTGSAVGKSEDVDSNNSASHGPSAGDDDEKKALMEAERERELEEKRLRRERERELREAEKERKEEEKRRREEQKRNVEWAASTLGYTKEELAAMKNNIKFEERFKGMLENKHEYGYDTTVANGPSQVRLQVIQWQKYTDGCSRLLLTQVDSSTN